MRLRRRLGLPPLSALDEDADGQSDDADDGGGSDGSPRRDKKRHLVNVTALLLPSTAPLPRQAC